MVSFVADLWVKWRVKTAKKMISESEIFSLVGWLMSHERPLTPKNHSGFKLLTPRLAIKRHCFRWTTHRLSSAPTWTPVTNDDYWNLFEPLFLFRKSLEGRRAKHNKFYLMSIEESELIFFLSFLCWCACLHNSRINVFKLNNPLKRW